MNLKHIIIFIIIQECGLQVFGYLPRLPFNGAGFMKYLFDGDPASNTFGWRWVAGIQTKGKQYLGDGILKNYR